MLIVVAGLVLVAAMVLYLVLHLPTRRGASVAREPDGAAGPPGRTSGSSRHWSRDARPTLLALLLALVSLPLVALTMGAVDTTGNHYSLATPIPATALGQWSAAASAVFVSALVAGTIGAPLVRSQKWLGGITTFFIALVVAPPALPLLPAFLGQHVGVAVSCMDVCSPASSTNDLTTGLLADLFIFLAPWAEPWPVLTLAVGVGIWVYLVRRLQP